MVKVSALTKMLDQCVGKDQYSITWWGDHRIKVVIRGKPYPRLPSGAHGQNDPEIQNSHIRNFIRFFEGEIKEDCWKPLLPQLG